MGEFKIEDLYKEAGTWVSVDKISWCQLENAFGR